MLTFYHHPLSPIARRVWWALLEKQIPFELVTVDLTGAQFEPEFLALNPFHHVPVITNGDFRLVESLAILDYLERQYPTPALLPLDAVSLGRVKMIVMVVANELVTKTLKLVAALAESEAAAAELVQVPLSFLNQELGDRPYFGGSALSQADIVAGTAVPLIARLGLSLEPYPALAAWCNRITSRPAWQQTNPDDKGFAIWRRFVAKVARG
jgi:glutathione S-transferase